MDLVAFTVPLLGLGKEQLKSEVCRLASTANMTMRFLLKDFAPYIDSVVAPLAFMPYPEGTPCSVVHVHYGLTKACLEREMHAGIDRMIEEFGLTHLIDGGTKEERGSVNEL